MRSILREVKFVAAFFFAAYGCLLANEVNIWTPHGAKLILPPNTKSVVELKMTSNPLAIPKNRLPRSRRLN